MAAKEPTPEAQISVLHGIKERGRVAEDRPPPPASPDDYGRSAPIRAPGGRVAPSPTSSPDRTFGDIIAWAAGVSEADLWKLADFSFDVLSTAGKLRFDAKVRTWIAEHARRNSA